MVLYMCGSIACRACDYLTLLSLSDLVVYGVGFHHAGMDISDRKAIETMFTCGDLPVLCECAEHILTSSHHLHTITLPHRACSMYTCSCCCSMQYPHYRCGAIALFFSSLFHSFYQHIGHGSKTLCTLVLYSRYLLSLLSFPLSLPLSLPPSLPLPPPPPPSFPPSLPLSLSPGESSSSSGGSEVHQPLCPGHVPGVHRVTDPTDDRQSRQATGTYVYLLIRNTMHACAVYPCQPLLYTIIV